MATVEKLTPELVTVNSKLVNDLQPQQASRGGRGGQSRECGRGAGGATPTIVTPTGAVSDTRTDNQDLELPLH